MLLPLVNADDETKAIADSGGVHHFPHVYLDFFVVLVVITLSIRSLPFK
ncbi:MAG: hypothetical protein WCF23_02965 [Candidatus Nitrosopolaris sp.]